MSLNEEVKASLKIVGECCQEIMRLQKELRELLEDKSETIN